MSKTKELKVDKVYSRSELEKLLNDYASHILLSYVRGEEHSTVKIYLDNLPRDFNRTDAQRTTAEQALKSS